MRFKRREEQAAGYRQCAGTRRVELERRLENDRAGAAAGPRPTRRPRRRAISHLKRLGCRQRGLSMAPIVAVDRCRLFSCAFLSRSSAAFSYRRIGIPCAARMRSARAGAIRGAFVPFTISAKTAARPRPAG
jgi:hypothetical protein